MGKPTGVVLMGSYKKMNKKWLVRWILTNCVYLILIGFLGASFLSQKTYFKETINSQGPIIENYKLRFTIYEVLRHKGISLGQGMDIAQIIVDQCRELKLPPDLVLAVMKRESEFFANAKSDKGAMGIMQVMPTTWHTYVDKLKLGVSIQAAWDPLVNIKVGTHILKDFYDSYSKKSRSEEEVWKLTLSAYNSGPNGGVQTKYVRDVTISQKEMNKKIAQ
jgi:soluble lytic murein transglycosylase-like protein